MMDQIKMEGFFVNGDNTEKVREDLLNQYKEIIRAFDRKDMKRMSLLIYDDFMKHFATTIFSKVMVDGGCIKRDVEEFLNYVRLDLTTTINRLGGEMNVGNQS